MGLIRLDRILSVSGCASRSQAARLIRGGHVTVDGRTVRSGSEKFDPEAAVICVCGKRLDFRKNRYFMMNKPAGVVSATEDRREKTVIDLLREEHRRFGLFPAGRLDKDSEGLLILTNDGDFAHRLTSPLHSVFKTYYVETDGELKSSDVEAFSSGIVLADGTACLPARMQILETGETSRALVKIREGKYHQVKRMMAAVGKRVRRLKRVAIGGLELDPELPVGHYREMSDEEVKSVFRGGDMA